MIETTIDDSLPELVDNVHGWLYTLIDEVDRDNQGSTIDAPMDHLKYLRWMS